MAKPDEKLAQFLVDLMVHTAELLKTELKIDDQQADALGYQLADTIRQVHGGSNIYMPKGVQMDAAIKKHGIINDFRGNNHAELARKYNCSEVYIYQVIRAYTLATRKTLQPGLFQDDENN
ncbi:Mor transcription activator family protein [Alishewanella jeotgali]|jgi:Mor family transcriptional regulator|uniref:Phage regulatory protein n=1 Tax=Alishewanella jeotgali KCTC 22429 TaxID=1129374 RepID=H3Z9K2_9ALTE|nr:Mor transcription activator family protein [Alishewanella jeotgali]EHR42703.1 phage regulatory protein [Alishewanella jeotgali KCTC 22429]